MPVIQAYGGMLPLTPEVFDVPQEVQRLTTLSLMPQGSKPAAASAAYFRVEGARSPWRAVNQALLEEAALQVDGERPLAAWLEVASDAMESGLIVELAEDYRAADYVFVRVAGFPGGYAPVRVVRELLLGIARLSELGLRPILDCVGPGGVAALTVGAHAYTGGYPYFRHVPEKVTQGGGPPIPGPRLRWLREDTLVEMVPAEAVAALADGEFDVSGCRCDPSDPDSLRRHAIHVNRGLATIALSRPVDETLERLHQVDSRPARTWAAAAAQVIGITLPKTQSAR